MSVGIIICSKCKREVHQWGSRDVENGWIHCEDHTPRCEGAVSECPATKDEIVGRWCGADDFMLFPGDRDANRSGKRHSGISKKARGVHK